MPVSETISSSGDWVIPEKVYSMRIRMYGGSGGGEFINNDINLTPTAGTNGGETTFLGMIAGGGRGGGVGGRNAGGTGGTATIGYDWGALGATVFTANGKTGQFNSGGTGGVINAARIDGGYGTQGIFTYSSYVQHDYINPGNNLPGTHVLTSSSPDLSVGFLGGEGTGYSSCWCKQAAGGNTTGPFYITGGGAPNTTKNTFIRTSEYGWLSFLYDGLSYEVGVSSYNYYSDWNSGTNYGAGSFVVYQSLPYRAKLTNSGNIPSDSPSYWQLLTVTQRISYFRVFFCRAGGSTYIKCFNFTANGKKQGAIGRGGGGAATIETTLTRQMLLDSGIYAPNTTQSVTIGDKGTKGGTTAADGSLGYIDVFMYIIPTVILTANKTEIIRGETVTLEWTTTGDADRIDWTSGELTNNNLTSFAYVDPIDTTTYIAVASGLGGSSDPAVLKLTVYQPPEASIEVPVPAEILYGENPTIGFSTKYANTAIKITPYYSYLTYSSEEAGDTIIYGDVANSAEIGTVADTVVSTDNLEVPIAYNNFGPYQIRMVLVAEGSGGTITVEKTISVIIDQTPDNVIIPEKEDAYKDEDPVFAPETDIRSELISIDGIDIPVEVKANYPIQVDINQEGIWRNVRNL